MNPIQKHAQARLREFADAPDHELIASLKAHVAAGIHDDEQHLAMARDMCLADWSAYDSGVDELDAMRQAARSATDPTKGYAMALVYEAATLGMSLIADSIVAALEDAAKGANR